MSESLKEIVDRLRLSESYWQERRTVSDEIIDFIKENLPREYELIQEKEEDLKQLIELMKDK